MNSSAHRKTILAGFIGNILEWYDFAVYGYFAPIIASHFFPSDDPTASLIATFGVFAAGYMARPIGGAIFGHIGDIYGRKLVLTLSVGLMGISTFLIGVLPDHAAIGVSASILLLILRLLQGLSVGGEFTGSIVFLVENARENRRGLTGSWANFGAILGFLIGSGIGAACAILLTQEQLDAWGWREPFLVGILIAFVGMYIRHNLTEIPLEETDRDRTESPALTAVKTEWPTMLRIGGLILMANVGFYLMFVYMTTYLSEIIHVDMSTALEINTLCLAVILLLIPVGGYLSDKFGRRPILLAASLSLLVFSYPLMALIHHQNMWMILAGQMGFAILIGLSFGVNPAALVEMVPARIRCSTLSIAYNACLAIFGGTTPLVATYLIHRTNDDLTPAYMVMAVAAVTTLVVLTIKETARKPLP
ncbi:MAG: MFS transporter [Rhodospirillaceae bacterium]|nr:MFS transporter [Rhodospirillaceae bacterium]